MADAVVEEPAVPCVVPLAVAVVVALVTAHLLRMVVPRTAVVGVVALVVHHRSCLVAAGPFIPSCLFACL